MNWRANLIRPFVFKAVICLFALCCYNAKGFSFEFNNESTIISCDYLMCQYEKTNIDQIILYHAKINQTVMFGEIHDVVIIGYLPPIEDSRYVISLLYDLKVIGYDYLALEVNETSLPGCHSHDMMRFLSNYIEGQRISKEEYPFIKPGWMELVTAALENEYKLVFINRPFGGMDRDSAMYYAMQTDIFNDDPNAKVLVYIGANHISETETTDGFSSRIGTRKPLGFLLNQYTKGRNFSVYMGYPWDIPVGCDLFIGDFIWNTFKNAMYTGVSDNTIVP
jgi:hypothetical protein